MTADGQNAGMAAVAFYGSTAEDEHNFPLVLIFGREFNNKEAVAEPYKTGQYCFFKKCCWRSTFWKRSYGLAKRVAGYDVRDLAKKSECSPILFTNALHVPIPDSYGYKDEQRARIDSASNQKYLEWIFRAPILARVEVVIMSGLQDEVFTGARELILQNFSRRQVHVGHIPYLGSRVLNCQIDSIINDKDREAFQKVLWNFRNIF